MGKEPVKLECKYCGTPYLDEDSEASNLTEFCSRACEECYNDLMAWNDEEEGEPNGQTRQT